MYRLSRAFAGLGVALMLTACGGGHSSSSVSPQLPGPAPLSSPGSVPAAVARYTTSVALNLTIPAVVYAAGTRAPKYVSPGTKSLAVTATPTGSTPGAPTLINCSGSTCSGSVTAPIGQDTFTVKLYDAANGTGNELSEGTQDQFIVAGAPNTVTLIFNAVATALMVDVSPAQVAIGTPSTSTLQVVATDATGNTIVGPGNFTAPIQVTSTDTSGHTKLSATTITTPGQKITVTYDGQGTPGTVTYSAGDGKIAAASIKSATLTESTPTNGPHGTGAAAVTNQQLAAVPKAQAAPGTLPTSVDLRNVAPPIGDQGQEGSCVGWSTTYLQMSYLQHFVHSWSYFASGTQLDNNHIFSPAWTYNQLNGGKDGGLNPVDALNLLVTKGAATMAEMPYTAGDFLTQPSGAATADAVNYKLQTFRQLDKTDVRGMKQQLASGNMILIGVTVDAGFQTLGPGDIWHQAGGAVEGGHAMNFVGYDDAKNAFLVQNQWGTAWGDHGYTYLDYTYMQQVLQAAFVLKAVGGGPTPVDPSSPDPNGTPTPLPSTAPTNAPTASPSSPPSGYFNLQQYNLNYRDSKGRQSAAFAGAIGIPPGYGQYGQIVTFYAYNDAYLDPVLASDPAFSISGYAGDPLVGYTRVFPIPVGGGYGTWTTSTPYEAFYVPPNIPLDILTQSVLFIDNFEIASTDIFEFSVQLNSSSSSRSVQSLRFVKQLPAGSLKLSHKLQGAINTPALSDTNVIFK